MGNWEQTIIEGFNVTYRFNEGTVDIDNITVPARTNVGDLEIALKKKYPQLKGLSLFGADFETVLTGIIFDQLWAEKTRREEEAGARKRPLPSQKAIG